MKFTELIPGLDRLLGGPYKRKVRALSGTIDLIRDDLRRKDAAIAILMARADEAERSARRPMLVPPPPAVGPDDIAALRRELSETRAQLQGARTEIEALRQQDAEIRAHLQRAAVDIDGMLRHESARVDYALGEIEGLGRLRDEFIARRRTSEYQRAFDEKEPLVSVCVTTFNRAELLMERAIASLQAQTYANLQIIVVGDHCSDDTGERLAALGDPRIEFHNLPRPTVYPRPGRDRWYVAGTGPAQFAATRVRGTFITALDEDDTYTPDRIATAVEAAQRERADFVWHKFMWQNPDGSWREAGNGLLQYSQLSVGMCLFHHALGVVRPDIHAYRADEAGDWNFIRRLKHLRPNTYFIDRPMTNYYVLPKREPTEPAPDETYLE